jgi:hypothetical protein
MVQGEYIHSQVIDPAREYYAYCAGCHCKHYSPFFRNITEKNIDKFKHCLPYFASDLKVSCLLLKSDQSFIYLFCIT